MAIFFFQEVDEHVLLSEHLIAHHSIVKEKSSLCSLGCKNLLSLFTGGKKRKKKKTVKSSARGELLTRWLTNAGSFSIG